MSTPSNAVVTITPDNHVLMIAPGGGEAAYVPQDQVASYESKGAKIGVRMTAPDGQQKAIVPFDQQDTYQKQGATWDVSPDNDAVKSFMTQRQQQTQADPLSRANANMTAAMSGQPMSTPQDQAQFEAGKKAGTSGAPKWNQGLPSPTESLPLPSACPHSRRWAWSVARVHFYRMVTSQAFAVLA